MTTGQLIEKARERVAWMRACVTDGIHADAGAPCSFCRELAALEWALWQWDTFGTSRLSKHGPRCSAALSLLAAMLEGE